MSMSHRVFQKIEQIERLMDDHLLPRPRFDVLGNGGALLSWVRRPCSIDIELEPRFLSVRAHIKTYANGRLIREFSCRVSRDLEWIQLLVQTHLTLSEVARGFEKE